VLFQSYKPITGSYDELIDADGSTRPWARRAVRILDRLTPGEFGQAQSLAELSLYNQGVTFSVYSDKRGTEKIFPICLCPRVIAAEEWTRVERGLAQRIAALCAFLDDVYGDQLLFRSGNGVRHHRFPEDLILGAKFYLPKLRGLRPPGGVRIPIAGIDLIRSPDGQFRVLEDNVRTPSGVSYVVENRLVTKRIFQGAVDESAVRPVEQYPLQLAETLRALSPVDAGTPGWCADTGAVQLRLLRAHLPGPHHGHRAGRARRPVRRAGHRLRAHHLRSPAVHVIYRRVDDAYLDPEFFRPDSLAGRARSDAAYAAGNVSLVNAPGNGCADDKAVYPFVPDMISYYLGEEPILPQVDTFVCARPDDLSYVVENLPGLVVKAVDEAGGYGMLMGPQASAAEREEFRRRVLAEPRRYIAQHRVELSTCPTWDPDRAQLAPRRVDLRPFILTRPSGSWVLPGGLTRVALVEGSYVVNSSQGGGSKDTWVQRSEA
jgi:uncharacterized circularly permuted ATP-grasp superfamily protein